LLRPDTDSFRGRGRGGVFLHLGTLSDGGSPALEKIKENIYRSEPFERLARAVQNASAGEQIVLSGVAGSLLSFIAAFLHQLTGRQILLVASEREKAAKTRDDLELLLGPAAARFFGDERSPQRPVRSTYFETFEPATSIAQIETLMALASNSQVFVAVDPAFLSRRLPPPQAFLNRVIVLETQRDYGFQRLLDQLESNGFARKGFVEGYGDYAVRGGIVDVFPFVGEHPIRIEFWGDTVESVREFDVLSQRSIKELNAASIVPDVLGRVSADHRNETYPSDQTAILERKPEGDCSLLDYLNTTALVLLDEPVLIQRSACGGEDQNGRSDGEFFEWQYLERQLSGHISLVVSSLQTPHHESAADERLVPTDRGTNLSSQPKVYLDFHSHSQPSFNASVKALYGHLQSVAEQQYSIFLLCENQPSADRLKELLEEVVTEPDPESGAASLELETNTCLPLNFEFLPDSIHHGFLLPSASIAVYTEHEIFGRNRRRGVSRKRHFKGFSAREFQALKKGDFVVHVDHGIGRFDGLQKLNVKGIDQEVARLLYEDGGVLYVNLNYINRIQKYASKEGHIPKLTRLGSPDWERLKARAKRRIKEIARDLIQLYARRKHEKGIAFSQDTYWQKELEASFLYEDTPDQASATIDVKRDMESENPMDRLICGDVGFGKTEVAVRAAFKAVMDSRQVAMLVPTTILALQHYNTFLDRLSKYPVHVEVLSRFKSRNEQGGIISGLKSGTVDVVIGTHRLLSKDVAFQNLGLFIIDEEHRFGVAAKEKLRKLKSTVDTLTLTATPIPRTLHFSLMGARDLSIIQTPPRNRLPIITEITEFNMDLIRDAILREVHRGGQVYFVHDRVQRIDDMASLLQEHVPEAKFRVAHGQMRSHELEKAMVDFLEKKFDVLVCTKIIESGLDIPNVNTIFVHRADRFGMAELYQLRGRVGRSNIQAYAYLLVPPISVLPKSTIRRLQAVEEFTELGSGFNLAMRDLEIRGAGNLLGAEQSGFIETMGFEMYSKILEEAVVELKQEEFTELFKGEKQRERDVKLQATVDVDVDAYIPEFYVEKDFERLDIYRRLYEVKNLGQLEELQSELADRFGKLPEEVENLFQLIRLRVVASEVGFQKVKLSGETLVLEFPDESYRSFYEEGRFQAIMERVAPQRDQKMQMKQQGKTLELIVRLVEGDGSHRIRRAEQWIRALLEPSPGAVASPVAKLHQQ